ncbi:MAG: hypothetical protein J2P49_05735, partial [Methylocapsa sp.]|nr:hypothetical protein [Methylocapsa sp.]
PPAPVSRAGARREAHRPALPAGRASWSLRRGLSICCAPNAGPDLEKCHFVPFMAAAAAQGRNRA